MNNLFSPSAMALDQQFAQLIQGCLITRFQAIAIEIPDGLYDV